MHISRLSRLQKRFKRVILNNYTSPSLNLFTQLHWFTVKERIEFEFSTTVLVFKCLNNLAPEILQSLFQPCGSCQNYPLRNVGIDLKVLKPRTETLQKSFGYMSSVIWNKLPSNVKSLSP